MSTPRTSAKLVVISGPSGVGKSSIVEGILQSTSSVFSVSATSRSPRTGEREGVEYHFVDRAAFHGMVESGEILEWAVYGSNLYGTLRSSVQPILDAGRNVILDIENEGAKQIRESYPNALLIFVSPPDLGTLEARLGARGDTSQSDISLRLSVAAQQISEAPDMYDHIVENVDLEQTIDQVLAILGADHTDAALD